jgi:hypothetical protein
VGSEMCIRDRPEEVAERRHRPEVTLKFYGKANKDPSKGMIQPTISMQVSFRLMTKTIDDFAADGYLKELASAIHREFGTPPFKITKGIETYTYTDPLRGYQLRLDVNNQSTAVAICKKVLSIQRHKFEEEYFKRTGIKPLAKNDKSDKYTVMGKQKTVDKGKKVGVVSFTGAYLLTGVGGIEPITLVDLLGKKNAIFNVRTSQTMR